MLVEKLTGRPMRGLIAIQRDLFWQPALALESLLKKRLCGCGIPLGTEEEIDGLSFFINRTIKIGPPPFDLHIGLVDAPGGASPACEAVPAPFETPGCSVGSSA